MFLDISFIGAANYRKDGYAKIYNSLRKHRRRSICVEDSNASHLIETKEFLDTNKKRNKYCSHLNASLQLYKYEKIAESNCRKSKNSYVKVTEYCNRHQCANCDNRLENRLYLKNSEHKISSARLNKVSLGMKYSSDWALSLLSFIDPGKRNNLRQF